MANSRRKFIKISALGLGGVAATSSSLNMFGANSYLKSTNKEELKRTATYCEVCFWKCAAWAYTNEDGAIKKSVIKLNYVFTISKNMVYKKLFLLSEQKKYEVYIGLRSRLSNFNNKLNELVDEKLKKYFSITKEALDMVKGAFDVTRKEQAIDFYDMASRYYSDAQHFFKKGDYINAFAAVNYSHGWLDAGARIKLFNVNDNKLFTVD